MTPDQAWSLVVAVLAVAVGSFLLGYLFGWVTDAGKEAFARRWAATGIREDRAVRARRRSARLDR